MRLRQRISIALTAALLPGLALSQQKTLREIFSGAEIAYPSATAPSLFATDSLASDYAAEPESRMWSSDMEARILEEIDKERNQGLVVRRTDVECRTSTCAVLLVHATSNGSEGTVKDLTDSLRQKLGFDSVITAQRQIPLQFVDHSDPTRPMTTSYFVSGYVEIVLVGGVNANLQAQQDSQ